MTTVGLIVASVLVWLLSGVYTVNSGEEAVVLMFGRHVATVRTGGLKWHIPAPFETVHKERVAEVKRMEFGFRTVREGSKTENAKYQEVPEEALMLTGDENLAYVETIVQYRIADIEKYLFNVDDQEGTFRVAAESAIRRVIANHTFDEALTDNKLGIQQEIKSDLQAIVDKYGFGITVTAVQLQDVSPPAEVDQAFKDVASAREDKASKINEAMSYANEKIPVARGEAAKMLNDAEAYKQARINQAKGDTAMFTQLLEKYRMGKDVTRTRLYLETLEEVFPKAEIYIVNDQGETIKFLPLGPGSVVPAPGQ